MLGEIIIKVEKILVLDVTSKNTSEVMAKQYDVNSRFLRIALKSGYSPINVKSDAVVIINAKRSDGEVKSFSGVVNEDGTVTVPITGWMMQIDKPLRCDISIIDGASEAKLTTMSFNLIVESAINSSEEIADDDKYDVLVSLISDLSKGIDECNEMIKAVNRAAELVGQVSEEANAAKGSAYEALETARKAVEGIEDAIGALNAAADGAENINISAVQTGTGADITVTDRNGEETTVHIDSIFVINTWAEIRNAVRFGLGPKLFPVGYEFTTHNSDYDYDIIWRVVGHDHHKAANDSLEYTMTLEAKNLLSSSAGSGLSLQFDAPEALYYAEKGLKAGTYNFTWNYATGSIVSGTYQFTLTKNVPAGGQIAIGTDGTSKALTACKISTYEIVGAAEALESGIAIKAGSVGESLGEIASTVSSDEKLNCAIRIISGSNNYAQSAIDELLNSSAEAGSAWVAKSVFDRPPSWINTRKGFMHGLPDDFLAAVQPAVIHCRTCDQFEANSLDGTEFRVNQTYELKRRFFLLSAPEVFGTYDDPNTRDGEILEYYNGLNKAERVHRDWGGTARITWLRSPSANSPRNARVITEDGSVSGDGSLYTHRIAPACIIA